MKRRNAELEDFDLVTPDGVTRRIDTLNDAWVTLINANNQTPYVVNEYAAWSAWRAKILDSYLSRLFATGTLNELDTWQIRYGNAYNKSLNTTTAPMPDTVLPPLASLGLPNMNLVVSVLGIGAAAYLLSELGLFAKIFKS